MKSSERNGSQEHSTKWSQSMAQLRPWFLEHGSKRSRLDDGPSPSNRTVNSRSSEIDPNTTERSPPFPVGVRSTKERMELLPGEPRKTLISLYSQEPRPAPLAHRNSSPRCGVDVVPRQVKYAATRRCRAFLLRRSTDKCHSCKE